MNFHGYSLIQNGEKKRLKFVDAEMKQEFGNRFEEENEIYQNSYEESGKLLWKDENDEDDFFTEDQLMEDFTFKVAKRRLGVQIDLDEAEYLFEKTEFKIFQLNNSTKTEKSESNNFKWKKYLIIGGIIILVRILMKTTFK